MRRSLVLVFLVACSSSVDYADYRDAQAHAICEYEIRCGVFANETDCRDFWMRIGSFIEDPNFDAAVEGGRVHFDGEAASECLDALSAIACNSHEQHEPDACDRTFSGTVKNGGTCLQSAECVGDLVCRKPTCTMACCTGTCAAPQPIPTLGEACRGLCTDGAYCGRDNICHAVLPAGASCDTYDACDPDQYCNGFSTTTNGLCTRLPEHGEPCVGPCSAIGDICRETCVSAGLPGSTCDFDGDCASYYVCVSGECTNPPPLMLVPNGSSCQSGPDCESHYCGFDSLCADVPLCI